MVETESRKTKEKKDKEEKKTSLIELAKLPFKELVKKLEEFIRKKKTEGLSREEEQLAKKHRKEIDSRIDNFLQNTVFGQEVKAKKQDIDRNLVDKLGQLEHASPKDYKEKKEEFQLAYQEVLQQAQEHLMQYSGDSEAQDMAEYVYRSSLKQANQKFAEIEGAVQTVNQQQGQEREEVPPSMQPTVDKINELNEMMNSEDPQKRALAQQELANLRSQMMRSGLQPRYGYGLSEAQIYAVKTDAVEREKIFEDILARFGLDEDRQFREGDMQAQSQWIDFMLALREKEDTLKTFTLRFGFEEKIHNLNAFLSGYSHISKIPEVMSQFSSPMMDVAIRTKGAVAAFRAYEQAFERMAMIDGYLDQTKFFDPDKPEEEKMWLENWVKKQVRETLIDNFEKEEGSRKAAELRYQQEIEPYEKSVFRTGKKIFIASLRGDEIQASLPDVRKFPTLVGAPWHEDLYRRLDPLSMAFRYWDKKPGVMEFLEDDKKEQLSKLYFFYTGRIKKDFQTFGDWQKAMEEIQKKGEFQTNIFDIGGVLSASDWRAEQSITHVPVELTRFMGLEIAKKKLTYDKKFEKKGYKNVAVAAKRNSLVYGLLRNPLGVFRLASEQDQDAILRACGAKLPDPKDKGYKAARKAFLEDVYDDLAQAVQRLVYNQQEEIKKLIYPKETVDERRAEINAFVQREKTKGLNFDFVKDPVQKQKLEKMVSTIQAHFGYKELEGYLDNDGHIGKGKRGNEAFERLVVKKADFSLGTEDAMMELFRFSDLGELALQRRFRDLGAAARAAEGLWKLMDNIGPLLQKPEKIVEALQEITNAVADYHGGQTYEYTLTIADRVLDMAGEDRGQKLLPWPACQLRDKWGLTSKAEKYFGQTTMSLDKEEMKLLIEDMIGADVFKGLDTKKAREYFYDKYHLHLRHFLLERTWRYGPAVIIGTLIAGVMIAVKQLEQEIEEVAKES
jgi:hypothetical protein